MKACRYALTASILVAAAATLLAHATDVHPSITDSACDLSGISWNADDRSRLKTGSEEEDLYLRVQEHHFNPHTNSAGPWGGRTAPILARDLWTSTLSAFNSANNRWLGDGSGSMHYLGRVLHVLEDMSSPPHVHAPNGHGWLLYTGPGGSEAGYYSDFEVKWSPGNAYYAGWSFPSLPNENEVISLSYSDRHQYGSHLDSQSFDELWTCIDSIDPDENEIAEAFVKILAWISYFHTSFYGQITWDEANPAPATSSDGRTSILQKMYPNRLSYTYGLLDEYWTIDGVGYYDKKFQFYPEDWWPCPGSYALGSKTEGSGSSKRILGRFYIYLHYYRVESSDGGATGTFYVASPPNKWPDDCSNGGTSLARYYGDVLLPYAVRISAWLLYYAFPPPDSISYPSSSTTGLYTVSWAAAPASIAGAATSYHLERSGNGGSSWSPVYSGSSLSYPENVGAGSWRYRVKASFGTGYSPPLYGAWRTGEYDCVVWPANTSTVKVIDGTLNGTSLNPANPEVTVNAGASLTGSFRVDVYNAMSGAAVAPLAATPTWGNPQTSYWGINSWVGTGHTTHTVNVNLTAPSQQGTYYVAVAMAGVYNYAQLMSGTHPGWPADWTNGNKLALRPAADFELAIQQGAIPYDWYTPPSGYSHGTLALAAVRIKVAAVPHTVSTPTTPTGPSSGLTNTSYTYATGGSSCSQGHAVEYQFDWGDGTQSSWGASSRSKSWPSPNTYTVKARGRCTSDTSIVSAWSGGKSVTIANPPSMTSITPTSGPKYTYMKITGQNFGSSAGSVQFSGGAGTVVSWSDTDIYCRAPAGVATGGVFVRTASGLDSGSATFTVTVPSIIHVNNTMNVSGIENGTTTYPFSTVQRGIDAASNGAEVVVAQGTYVENINFNGKAITVRSTDPDAPAVVAATIIDGNQNGSVVAFWSGEGAGSILGGFTVRNGLNSSGGGILCYNASPTIRQNIITGNSADWEGGGICCVNPSSPLIENNIIRDNVVENEYGWGPGGGIYCASWGGESTPTIRENIIENNVSQGAGGGIGCEAWDYTVGAWESEGWTTVYQGDVTITSTGWVTFEFQTPFDYNGLDNLLIDFSFNNDPASGGEPGLCLCSEPGGPRTILGYGGGDDPLTWSGNSPAPVPSTLVPNIRLGPEPAVAIGQEIMGTWGFPLATWSHDARTQVIYLASEIGGAKRISSLALNVAQVPGAPLTRWTIRVKHTSLAAYPASFVIRPVITENLIQDNTVENEWDYGLGGGIYCRGAAARIENNMIGRNRTKGPWGAGGGIYCEWGASVVRNNLIWGNEITGNWGGGVYCYDLAPQPIENNTVVNNSTGGVCGNGIACSPGQTITNCIVWGNPAEEGALWAEGGNFSISYSDIQGGEEAVSAVSGADVNWGPGNIDVDPLFADPAADDYHLKSQAGHWDPAANGGAGAWVTDSVTSPCIDAGDPASDYGNEPSPNGGRINMGAYGNTPFASKSVPAPVVASVLPDSGPPYTLMKVTGSWFGFAEGTVEVAGKPLTILAWSDTEIWCEVPPEATSGPLVVKRLNGVESNVVAFAVTDPTIIYVDGDNVSGIENGTTTYPFSTVQRAIRAATNGDTVEVAQGTYVENINFNGKAITVRSANPDDPAVVAATILDGNQAGSTVTFNHGEGVSSVLKGFTIRGGSGGMVTGYCGGGIYCQGASPTVEKNVITGNTALAHGGGIYCSGGSPTIRNNRVEGNEARWFGGGIALWNSTATVTGNLIRDNAAHWYGGGLLVHGPAAPTVRNNVFSGNSGSEGAGIACLYKCSPLLENNTLTGNTAERYGGAVFGGWNCSPIIRNTIAWANSAPEGPELAFWVSCQPTVAYSDVQGGQAPVYLGTGCSVTWGSGNLNLDPLIDASGYCHLKSTGGRYDRGSGLPPESPGAWVLDGVTSPCIDSGDPLSAYASELLPNGSRINMGAWGNTPYASKPAGVGGLALGGTSAPADGAAAVGPAGVDGRPGDEAQENERDGDGGEDQGTRGIASTTVPMLVLVGVSPRLESTDPVLGGNLAGRTTLTLTFDRPVTVGAGAAEVYGETTGAHADYSITYGDGKRTVRLEWASPLPEDAYEVRLVAEFVLDGESGLPLDGEVADPADPESLPSGDGKPGGDAELEFEAE